MKKIQQDLSIEAEERFAKRVIERLDGGLADVSGDRLERLAMSRKLALRAQKTGRPALALLRRPAFGAGNGTLSLPQGRGRFGLGVGLMAVVLACLFGIFQVEQQRRIEELADIDSALLSDDLPISAYADHGFNAYLKQNP
jgi:hypothetical protein